MKPRFRRAPDAPTDLNLAKEDTDARLRERGRLMVSLARIVENPKNERKVFRNMEGLTTSIRAQGLIEPLTVTPHDADGAYQIITGHRRYRAAKAAGLDMIEIIVRDPEPESQRRIKSLVSNVQREDIGPVEMAEALQSLLEEDEMIKSQKRLAEVIGKDKTWVSQMLRILDLPVELRRKVETSQLSLPYDAVAKIARLPDVRQQAALIDLLLGGATAREIRDEINALKVKPTHKTSKSGGKPKQSYATSRHALVIVQSQTDELAPDRVILALEEALQIARSTSSRVSPSAGGFNVSSQGVNPI